MLADRRAATLADPKPDAPPSGAGTPEKGRSLWMDAARRFRRNDAAFISLIVLLATVVFTIVGPFFARWNIETIDWPVVGSVLAKGAPSLEGDPLCHIRTLTPQEVEELTGGAP